MAQTILIVDDSVLVRRYVRKELEAQSFEVLEAASGADALDTLAQTRPALVLSDVNMAPMDGFELVKKIRESHPRTTLPILMLTTETDDEQRAKGRAAGANGWLVKPFEPGRMIAVIRHLLGNGAAKP